MHGVISSFVTITEIKLFRLTALRTPVILLITPSKFFDKCRLRKKDAHKLIKFLNARKSNQLPFIYYKNIFFTRKQPNNIDRRAKIFLR